MTRTRNTLADVPSTAGILGVRAQRPQTEAEWEREKAIARANAFAQIGARLSTLHDTFAILVDQVATYINEAMEVNGFWNGEQQNFASKVALIHSELSEMLEADRKGIDADDKIPEYTGAEAEAADTIIRLLDLAGHKGGRLGDAIIDKMLYNLTRPYKHGKAY